MKSIPLALAVAAGLALGTPAGAASNISVSDVWSRPATGTGAVYATVRNSGSTRVALVAAVSPVAKEVELHESIAVSAKKMPASGSMSGTMAGMSGMSGMPAMEMKQVHAIAVPADGTLVLKPGGYHIMLIGLHHDLHAGETFPLRLRFSDGTTVGTTVRVRSMSP